MSNLKLRIASAVVLGAVVLLVAWLGGVAFRLLASAMALAILIEWLQMVAGRNGGHWRQWRIGQTAAALLIGLAVALVAGVTGFALLALAIILVTILAVLSTSRGEAHWGSVGLAYAALSALSLAALRGDDGAGLTAILFLFAVVWATDILAYFVGRAIGGPKLAPSISPGKTRSGAVGGTVGGVIAGLALAMAFGAGNLVLLGMVALLLSVVSQAGDLFESWVKRRHNVKDSGTLIPGHGGVMDRVDGLVAAAFALYLIGSALGGIDRPASALFAQ